MGLSIIIHGGPGMGKSALAATAPGPRLQIDTEGGNEWLAGKVIMWTDLSSLPEGIDENTTVSVTVSGDKAMETFQTVYQWLMVGRHPFKSVIMDSLSEMQSRIKDKVTPVGGGDPDWTIIQPVTEKMIRDLKDLKTHTSNPLTCIVFVSGSKVEKNKDAVLSIQPALAGQLGTKVAHFVDVCGYTTLVKDPENPLAINGYVQYLQIMPDEAEILKVKDRTSPPGRAGISTMLGPVIAKPSIPVMLEALEQAKQIQPVA